MPPKNSSRSRNNNLWNKLAISFALSTVVSLPVACNAAEDTTNSGITVNKTATAKAKSAKNNSTAISRGKFASLKKEAKIAYENGDYKSCQKKLKRARKAYLDESNADITQHASLTMLQGDCDYREEKYSKAVTQYEAAYAELKSQKNQSSEGLIDCLNDLGGAYYHEKDYKKAAEIYEELLSQTETSDGRDSPKLLWTCLDLVNVYKKLDRTEDASRLRGRLLELISASVDNQTLEKGVRAEPSGSTEQRPIPLIVWRSKSATPKAMIIAIHGLGLHCSSFQKFAERMSEQNYSVGAMDVRGFGAWRIARGSEQIDLENSIQDIAGLVHLTHMKFPDVPVFVLGESMGGALALQYAAEFPDEVSGVISSVPADRRYKESKEAFRVAVNFLKHPNKQISVENVLSRAATTDSVSKGALEDPMMRAEMSPKELIKFQIFMTQTAQKVHQIKNCPVLMLQGMEDRLAKPGATIDIFNNLATADRDLYLLGQCQHLIFEEVDTSDIVFNSVLLWIENRIKQNTHPQSKTSVL